MPLPALASILPALGGAAKSLGSSTFGKSGLQGLGFALGKGLGQNLTDEDDETALINQLQASIGQRIGTQSFNPNISPVQGILGN